MATWVRVVLMVRLSWWVEWPASLDVSDLNSGRWTASLCVDWFICAIIAQIDMAQFVTDLATNTHKRGRTP